jgi:hypothetical protein
VEDLHVMWEMEASKQRQMLEYKGLFTLILKDPAWAL